MSAPMHQTPGPMASYGVIGEVTEGLHKLLLDSYDLGGQPPRIEEDLKFVPKDREEVIYIYMYRAAQNPNLLNEKRWRPAPIEIPGHSMEEGGSVLYQRPPLIMDLFYLLSVHSKFRSDAERLLGWVVMTLHEHPVLIRRPRRFILPDGQVVDSRGREWDPDADADGEHREKISVGMVDDLTIGDAINLYTIHEAPYRPFMTYRARVAMLGSMVSTEGPTQVRAPRAVPSGIVPGSEVPGREVTRSGRIKSAGTKPTRKQKLPGPKAHNVRKLEEESPTPTAPTTTENESED